MWYSYAVIRMVPRVERGEFLNVGVVLFSREQDFLGARFELDASRLVSLAPDVDLVSGVRPFADARPRHFCQPLVKKVTDGTAAGICIRPVLERMEDLGEFSADFFATWTIDVLTSTIRKTGDPRPRTVGASVDRPFAVGSPLWQGPSVVQS